MDHVIEEYKSAEQFKEASWHWMLNGYKIYSITNINHKPSRLRLLLGGFFRKGPTIKVIYTKEDKQNEPIR